MDLIKQQLDGLLNSNDYKIDSVEESAEKLLVEVKKNGLFLFGSGGFGRRTLKGLRELGIEPLGFVDKNPKLWGQFLEECKVYSPEEAVQKRSNAIYMVTIWSDKIGHPIQEIESLLCALGKVTVTSFFWLYYKYPKTFLPYFSLDLPAKTIGQATAIYSAFSLFEDEMSRREFVAQISMRLNEDVKGLGKAVGSKYHFSNDLFDLDENEIVIDIGAFDGDTLKDFINIQHNILKKYIAFEPDPSNFLKLEAYAKNLPEEISKKIIVEQFAVSNEKKQIAFDAEGSLQSAYSEHGNIIVNCISLDEYLFNMHPTYIKIDAEGAEPDIINGASRIITNDLPILAISVYHQFDHLWSLPLAINELSNNYFFYLRPLCNVSWDLICYAVPKQRKKNQ